MIKGPTMNSANELFTFCSLLELLIIKCNRIIIKRRRKKEEYILHNILLLSVISLKLFVQSFFSFFEIKTTVFL